MLSLTTSAFTLLLGSLLTISTQSLLPQELSDINTAQDIARVVIVLLTVALTFVLLHAIVSPLWFKLGTLLHKRRPTELHLSGFASQHDASTLAARVDLLHEALNPGRPSDASEASC